MKTIIAGSRTMTNIQEVQDAISNCGWQISTVLCGMAKGVDKLGEEWAKQNNVPVEYYPAKWEKHGKSAGYKRNLEMAEHAEALIAIWDGESKGTKHMINIAKNKKLKIYVYHPTTLKILNPDFIVALDSTNL